MSRAKTKSAETDVVGSIPREADMLRMLSDLVRVLGSDRERLAYSVDELVGVVGFSRGLLYTVMDDGRLIARKLDGRTVVLRTDLLRFLEELPVRAPKVDRPESRTAT